MQTFKVEIFFMNTPLPETRNQMAGAHFTAKEKQFIRIEAAKQGSTTSSFIRNTISAALSKVEAPDNPFKIGQNNT